MATQEAALSVREKRFVNNFVGSTDATDRWWKANLDEDLRLYRYPHTETVRRTVEKLMDQKAKTGSFEPLPEEA